MNSLIVGTSSFVILRSLGCTVLALVTSVFDEVIVGFILPQVVPSVTFQADVHVRCFVILYLHVFDVAYV